MDVVGYDPYISVETAWRLSTHVQRAFSLDEIFATCDYITLHIPLTDQTRGIIGEHAIQTMKKVSVSLTSQEENLWMKLR